MTEKNIQTAKAEDIHPNDDEEQPSIPVFRWTKPGALDRLTDKTRRERFFFQSIPKPLDPINLYLGDANFKWVDGFWSDIGTDVKAASIEMTPTVAASIEEENKELASQIDILLDLNANYELKKAKLRKKLLKLKEQIRNFPGVEDAPY